ncbi:hypothetical protein BDZ89DRAFT_1073364 [Hymenopellis radicata]|nr:hypothetical protein BDZ89DRAFT_1073364 [Hymenopellis radicata]
MGLFNFASCKSSERNIPICAINVAFFVGLAVLAGIICWSFLRKQKLQRARASLIIKHSSGASPDAFFQPRRVWESWSTFGNRVVDRIVLHPLILRFRTHMNPKIVPQSPLLPQELCDAIIYLCSLDRTTLLACSLVSYTWVPASRRHLWYSYKTAERMHRFADLLRSPYETLSHHVHDVYLSIPRMASSSQYRRVFDILERKHAILRVQRSCVEMLLKYLMHIVHLNVHYGRFAMSRREEQLGALLAKCSTFCNLRHLAIHLQSKRTGDEAPDIRIPVLVKSHKEMPYLKTLCVTGWNTDIIGWLARSCGSLSSITFESMSPIADIPLFESLLRGNNASLAHLSVSISDGAPINLSPLTELTTVQLYISGPESVDAAVCTIQTCIGLQCLSTLLIRVRRSIDSDMYKPIWKSIKLLGKLGNPVTHTKMKASTRYNVYNIPTRAGKEFRLSG